jgi:hypothetical protein
MALFIVRHQHAAERCPAEDPQIGAALLNHLSRPNVRQHGVEIQGEAVVQDEHTLYLIVEAPASRPLMPAWSSTGRIHSTARLPFPNWSVA